MTKVFQNAIKAVRPNDDQNSIIPLPYDMSCEDFRDLMEMAFSGDTEAQWKAIALSFEFGFVMGNRATIARKLKRL